uniref:Uncharacterized protein n=1 Tax=Acrobeloides nanus TaxID=290746 RepID=A0A914CGR4_9BILA
MSTTDNHSLELWSACVYNSSFFTAVYDAPSLTNYVTTLVPWTNFGSVKSKSNSLTITIPSLFASEGQLNIIFDTEYFLNYTVDATKTFDDYGVGLIQSPAYPTATEGQDLMRLIQCTKGLASYTLEIVLADVPELGSLRIYGDSRVIRSYEHGRVNETVSFNATQVFVEYDAWFEVTNGILIRYEGIYIGNPDPPTTKANPDPPTTTAKAISNAISSTSPQPQHTVSHNSASNFYGVSWTLGLVLLFEVLRPRKFSNFMVVIGLWMLMSNCLVQGQDSTSATSIPTTTANPNCQCYSSSTFYLNSSNNEVKLYPTSTMGDNNYFQVKKPERNDKTRKHKIFMPKRTYGVLASDTTCPCLSCDYKIHTDYYQPGDAVYIDFTVHNVTCHSATTCKSGLMGPFKEAFTLKKRIYVYLLPQIAIMVFAIMIMDAFGF